MTTSTTAPRPTTKNLDDVRTALLGLGLHELGANHYGTELVYDGVRISPLDIESGTWLLIAYRGWAVAWSATISGAPLDVLVSTTTLALNP